MKGGGGAPARAFRGFWSFLELFVGHLGLRGLFGALGLLGPLGLFGAFLVLFGSLMQERAHSKWDSKQHLMWLSRSFL